MPDVQKASRQFKPRAISPVGLDEEWQDDERRLLEHRIRFAMCISFVFVFATIVGILHLETQFTC